MRISVRKSTTHNDLRFLASATPLRFVRNDRCESMPRNAAFQNKQSISSAFLHWQIFSDNGERQYDLQRFCLKLPDFRIAAGMDNGEYPDFFFRFINDIENTI